MSADFSKQHSLLMFSGGIDSLYVLYQLLHDTDDVLWVHHVNLVNREGRHRAEAVACANIVSWCTEHLRSFRYTESTIDHSAFQLFGRDVLLVAFEAGLVIQNAHVVWRRGFDRWLLGYCKEESDELVGGVAASSTNRRSIIETALIASAHPVVPPKLHSQPLIAKQAQIQAMPLELAQLAWTCRSPVWAHDTATECGRCKTCKLMSPIRASLAQQGRSLSPVTLSALP
jgi:hypothetical protein